MLRKVRITGGAAALAVAAVFLSGIDLVAQAAEAKLSQEAAHSSSDDRVKADFLYNLARFTRWPARAFTSIDAPLRLCVLGTDPFGEALAAIEGKRVGTRNLRTRLIARVSDIPDCHLLFVSASMQEGIVNVLAATDGAAILTVADIPGFARSGGVIALESADERNRFDVNAAAAGRVGLILSAKLLRLANTVIRE